MRNKKVYEKPRIIDLNGLSASGQQYRDRGRCVPGTMVNAGVCYGGDSPVAPTASCHPVGQTPEEGYCTLGNMAYEGCQSGGNHT
jgi:hypothetical protein